MKSSNFSFRFLKQCCQTQGCRHRVDKKGSKCKVCLRKESMQQEELNNLKNANKSVIINLIEFLKDKQLLTVEFSRHSEFKAVEKILPFGVNEPMVDFFTIKIICQSQNGSN